ncbi:MAG TPA: 6-bladed beta-propeller [Longimicrobiaceae bacterium]|nr:6-bladed beta-propeller [Longimicrobiaceae bacterium]
MLHDPGRTRHSRERLREVIRLARTAALVLSLGACESSEEGSGLPPSAEPAEVAERSVVIDGEFGAVLGLAVDRAGRIYAADGVSQEIRIFSPAGDPVSSIGRRGRGPGEFTGLQDVAVGRGDSLFAFDPVLQRVSVYAVGDSVALAYVTDVSHRSGTRAVQSVLVPSTSGVMVQYALPFNRHNLDARREIVLRRLDGGGSVLKDSLLVVPHREFLVTRDPKYGYSVGMLPFGRRPVLRLGTDDRLYYGWSDSLVISIYSPDGGRVARVGARRAAPPVTRREKKVLLGSYPTRFERKLLRKALRDGKIPSTKPAFKDFLVDGQGRVWVNVVTSDDMQVSSAEGLRYVAMADGAPARDGSPWWVIDSDGKRVATVAFPENATLHLIRDDEAFGVETDDLGVQTIVRYRLPAELGTAALVATPTGSPGSARSQEAAEPTGGTS